MTSFFTQMILPGSAQVLALWPSFWDLSRILFPCEYSQLHLSVKHDHEHEEAHYNNHKRVGALSLIPFCLGISGHPSGSRQGHPR